MKEFGVFLPIANGGWIVSRNTPVLDGGWAQNKSVTVQTSNTFLGVGLGMAFETKAGIFNISYANGKRNDLKFDLRESKIHIGYLNYF